ncbi:sensor histidine kinase [Catenuloplanes japonicus]|uniref:sensor histidine kinase n=1 Tax=Catenuloplanes japonicus TaxID=33876 RepID=UPI001E3A8ED9|nr:ATP-binding protein [Catenuloplanes japonicus]
MKDLVRGRTWRGPALASTVLALGLAATGAGTLALHAAEDDYADAALRVRANATQAAVTAAVTRYTTTAQNLATVAGSTPDAVAEVDANLARLSRSTLPGAHDVRLVAPSADRFTAGRPVDGSAPVPAGPDWNGPPPEIAAAMETSRDSGQLVISPPHVLPHDRALAGARQQLSFVIVAPVRATDGEFRGWVLFSLRGGDFLNEALGAGAHAAVTARLADVSDPAGAVDIASWNTDAAPADPETVTLPIAFGQRELLLTVRPSTPLLTEVQRRADSIVLAGGLLLSLAMSLLILVLITAQERATGIARRAVSDRRADADQLRLAQIALREREAELAGFSALAADKLQTPLTNVASYADLLVEEAGPQLDATSQGFLEHIGRSTHRMLRVVDELLAYTMASEAPLLLEPVDLAQVAAEVVAAHVAVSPAMPSIDIGALPVVTADASLLRQLLDHLVGNAVTYVRHGTAARVTIGARQDANGWWRIEVADRGIGIPAEHHKRVFAPFYRTPAATGYPGTGLGLATCRRIAGLHGGQVGVESNPGGGSVFWFTVFDGQSDHQSGEHAVFLAHLA